MNEGPYRSADIVNAPPPSGLVALLWRWILLRRADRIEAEERKVTLALATVVPVPQAAKRVTIRMVRSMVGAPYEVHRVAVAQCPGKSAPRPKTEMLSCTDYWLCTADNCCCEVQG